MSGEGSPIYFLCCGTDDPLTSFGGDRCKASTFLVDNSDLLIKHSAVQRDRVSLPGYLKKV